MWWANKLELADNETFYAINRGKTRKYTRTWVFSLKIKSTARRKEQIRIKNTVEDKPAGMQLDRRQWVFKREEYDSQFREQFFDGNFNNNKAKVG